MTDRYDKLINLYETTLGQKEEELKTSFTALLDFGLEAFASPSDKTLRAQYLTEIAKQDTSGIRELPEELVLPTVVSYVFQNTKMIGTMGMPKFTEFADRYKCLILP